MTTPSASRRASAAVRQPALLSLAAVLLAGCAAPAASPPAAAPPAEESSSGAAAPAPTREAGAASPRLVLTHDGGLSVLDAATLEPVAELELPGFLRLSDAGDGRHLAVSGDGGFHLLDAGAWTRQHGDHGHHYTTEPRLTGQRIDAGAPGHVVARDGRTAFFDDADGSVTLLDTQQLAAGREDAGREGTELRLPEAHHGVAVPLADGGLIVSRGDDQARTGAAVLAGDGTEVLAGGDCPGLHGVAEAADALAFGCEDGMLIHRDGAFAKVQSPDGYGRLGNQAGSPASAVILADYKTDPEADLERPRRVALVDTAAASMRLVDLDTSYSFRSLGRGPAGEALVLGTDGALHVIDPDTAELTARIPVTDAWEEPLDWQQPRPTLFVLGGTAYVTDPARRALHAVDLAAGAVVRSADLEHVPNELDGVEG